MKTDIGQGFQGLSLAGGFSYPGFAGTATATSATSLTMTGAGWNTSGNLGNGQWQGYVVIAGQGATAVMGTILSNTATSVVVDRWVTPAAPTTVGSTPGSTTAFVIVPLMSPVFYMALSNSNTFPGTHPVHTDTSLIGEITTAGGGLVRKAATYAQTFSTSVTHNTYTLTATFTANASDNLTAPNGTIYGIGTFNTVTPGTGSIMFHESALSTSATLSASGDQLTVTQTVTM